MEKTIKIIIATHKRYKIPTDSMYLPVYVGAAGKESIGYQRDDEGENISKLNPYFCELTAVYWAWKNLDADYIGIVHYRRHFSMHPYFKNRWEAVLKYGEIAPYLKDNRILLPKKRKYYIESLYSHYAHTHHAYQLDETRKIISERYPEYADSFDKATKRRGGYMFNMMIMEEELFNSYCAWLFDILFQLRDRLGEDGLSAFHSRYYGRISEIIFNVWIEQQIKNGVIGKNEMKEIPYIQMEKINWWKKGTAFLGAKFLGKKYEESF